LSERRPYLAANWKMHKTAAAAESFLGEFLPLAAGHDDRDIVVCPAYTALRAAVEATRDSHVKVAAQNMHAETEGAFTGEVSAAMLVEVGVDAVVLGHSERRQYFAESDEELARKVPAALEAGLEPIFCVGETEPEREAGATEAVLLRQVSEGLVGVTDDRLGAVVIAYEPVWAIGTGRTASAEQAAEAIAFIRGVVAGRSSDAAGRVRILYGGSVKPDNAEELLSIEGIDGALVGGASLDPEAFAAIVQAA
jgi:triosephosphate isomerase